MYLMRRCPCPVWVIKASPTKRTARILAAVDPDPLDVVRDGVNTKIMELATALAALEDSELHVSLQDLNGLIPIACADVSLARQHDTTPPFRAVVLLGVPGPDIHAAARDHTWPAAWLKVVARLRQQMEDRRSRQQARQRGPRHLATAPRQTNGARRAGRT
jgi:hypothetical protein